MFCAIIIIKNVQEGKITICEIKYKGVTSSKATDGAEFYLI